MFTLMKKEQCKNAQIVEKFNSLNDCIAEMYKRVLSKVYKSGARLIMVDDTTAVGYYLKNKETCYFILDSCCNVINIDSFISKK